MSAKSGGNRNKVRRICLLGIFCAVCTAVGYLESLLPLDFIAPGVKIGLANSVCLLLVLTKDRSGALAVNFIRILLCALIFGSAASLMFSLPAGIISLSCACVLTKVKGFSAVGISIISAVIHNTVQTAVAVIVVGKGALYYFPLLLFCAAFSGTLTGTLCNLILKKIKTNGIF